MEPNTLRKYLIAGGALLLVLAVVVLLLFLDMSLKTITPKKPITSVKAVDLSLGQRPEAPNAPLTPATALPAAVDESVEEQPLVPGCALHFSFAPTANTVAPGGQINYSIVVSNLGEETCQDTSFSIYYADNESFVSGSPKSTADNYYWVPGNLASRQTYEVTLSTQETATSPETQVQNEACATANNSSDVCADNLIFVQPGAPPMPASSSGVVTTGVVTPAPVVTTASAPASGSVWGAAFTSKQFGTWIWDSPITMTPSYEQDAIAAARQNGFNTIYLTVEDYLPIVQLPAGANKNAQQAAYFAALNNFIVQAKAANIAVYIEGGADNWGDVANRWQGTALVTFITQYDNLYPNAPIAGLQLDVESYLEPQYSTDPSNVLEGYLNLISDVTNAMKNVNAKLSIVIPHFYDDQIQWTPEIPFGGNTNYTYNHLLDILQHKPGSYMIDMAYRNTVTGTNGTEALSETEVKEAQGTATKIVVAQETGDVQPSYVTFYGLTKEDLYNALTAITNYYDPSSSFGGVAVHYLDPFLELKQ